MFCRCSDVCLSPLRSTSSSEQQQTRAVNCVNFTPGALRQMLYYATATTKTNKSIHKRTKTNTNKSKTRKQAQAVDCVNFTPQANGLSTSCDCLFRVVFIVVLVFVIVGGWYRVFMWGCTRELFAPISSQEQQVEQ